MNLSDILNQIKDKTVNYITTPYFDNGYQPNNINNIKLHNVVKDGKILTVGDTALKGTKNQAGKNIDSQKIWSDGTNYYIWIGDGTSKGGYYASFNPDNKKNQALDFTKKGIDDYVGSNTTVNYNINLKGESRKYLNLDNLYNSAQVKSMVSSKGNKENKPSNSSSSVNTNTTTKTNTTEKPKLATVEEMASDYGIDVDYNNILKDFNQQTEDYYDLVIAEQNRIRDRVARDNQLYDDNLLNNYIENYANASNTTVNQAARAATLLSSDLNNSYNSAVNDYALLQSIHEQEQARQKELAQNKLEAKTYENQLRQWLLDGAATKNSSDVNAYVADQGALANRYAADRSYQAGLANAAATKYAGLVNADATTQAFDNSMKQQLYDYYKSVGVNPDTSLANTFKYSQGIVK